jgi:cytochrome c5
MNKFKLTKLQTRLILALLSVWVLASSLCQADPPPGQAPASVPASAQTNMPAASAPKIKKQLTGAELYSIHCNRCHPERYPTERTAAQWKTIMLHMQVRAALPGSQARLILQYLQDNSGR